MSLPHTQPIPFDPVTATIRTIHGALLAHSTTAVTVTRLYLSRITALNPHVNAIITLNPEVLTDAHNLDHDFSTSTDLHALLRTKPLFAIPTLLKDNFDCPPMPTTAGCLSLVNLVPAVEGPTVTALKRSGALILGKANMHELALEGLTVSSLGGQTLNPWDLTRTPGGSSGGSGAALALGLAVLATGSDTVNSLRSPASACGVVSLRPTRGFVSRAGVVPLSYTHDAVGPMARHVEDLALMFDVMASIGVDENDDVTALRPGQVQGRDCAALLGRGNLKGVRLGLVEGFFDRTKSDETTPVNEVMTAMVGRLRDSGATVVSIGEEVYNSPRILATLDVQRFEYLEQLTRYLQRPESGGRHPQSMTELYRGGDYMVIPRQYDMVNEALRSSRGKPEYSKRLQGIEDLKKALADTFARNQLDALIYPEQANLVVKVGSPSQIGRNGVLGALTGTPVVVVRAGRSPASTEAPKGVPIGMEILGRPWTEDRLLRIASHIEQHGHTVQYPSLAEAQVDFQPFQQVPLVTPKRSIPAEYALGTIVTHP